MGNWHHEFPASFRPPQKVTDMVARGELEDLSWGNDSCPKFGRTWHDHYGIVRVVMFVGPEAGVRWDFEGEPRFTVFVEEDRVGEQLFFDNEQTQTDDLEEALAEVNHLLRAVDKKMKGKDDR